MRWLTPLIVLLVTNASVLAVKPARWVHATADDFKAGDLDNVVASNLGELKLSRQVKPLLEQNDRVSATYSLAEGKDGTIYAGTGPEGLLLALKDGKTTTVAELGQHVNIYSLLIDDKGRLLIGTGGESGVIYRIDKAGDKPTKIFSNPNVQYVWSMIQTGDGMLYAATGPNGQLFAIDQQDRATLLYDSDENNLLSMVGDGKDLLFIGTDPNGLVLEVNRKSGDMRVLYDAPESEISALARDKDGNLFAATADASAAGETSEPATEDTSGGRPEGESHGLPFPNAAPTEPKPPEVPKPSPGDPLPIPSSMLIHPLHLAELPEPSPTPTSKPSKTKSPAVPTGGGAEGAEPGKSAASGNAVYKIEPSGFVTEVFRQPLSVYSLIEQNGKLLLGTGEDGDLLQVDPAAQETLTLATVDSKVILSMIPTHDGRVAIGLANEGAVATLEGGCAPSGTFTSPVLDASQIARFGKMQLDGWLPEHSTLQIATRSGNVQEANSPGWSKWSPEMAAATFLQVPSSPARFLQYRLTFATTNVQDTPIVKQIAVAYQVANQAPVIKSVKIGDDTAPASGSKFTVSWEASDPNSDELQYSLLMRHGNQGPWVLLKDKLTEPTYEWETRNVADGKYWLKVEASDEAANALGEGKKTTRLSDPFIVDNTPPVIGDLKSEAKQGSEQISLDVYDRTSIVSSLEYAVDSHDDWQTVLPSDMIADSPEEAYSFRIDGLKAGVHEIALRASDSRQNQAFQTISVTVDAPPGK